VDGYRALLRDRDAGWMVDQIHAYADLDRVPRAAERAQPSQGERLHACA
jgi:hypothetical protein